MKQLLFTVGPSKLYPTVAEHMQKAMEDGICSLSHRSSQFEVIFSSVTEGLRHLLQVPKDYTIFFVSSGTEAMERTIQNLVEKKSFHFANGSFSKRWFEIAKELGKDANSEEADFGKGFPDAVKIPTSTELICFTQNETSSGVWIDPALIYDMQQQHSNALIAVDIVSSAPIVALDFSRLDCVFFSVQKNFGLPAGLGVVILSPRAVEKAMSLLQKGVEIGSYHNFPTLVSFAQKNQTPETPNVLGIYLLEKVVNNFQKKGIETMRKETEEKAEKIYDFLEQHKTYKPFVEKEWRSLTTIVADVEDGKKVQDTLKQQGIIVGSGYGPFKNRQIRIANFPAVTMKDVERLLNYL